MVAVPAEAVAIGAGSTTLVSIPSGFVVPFDGVNDSSGGSARAVSADGRYAVFSSRSDGLSSGQIDDPGLHCYRRDLTTGTTVLVDRASGAQGAVGNVGCTRPTISPDGGAVAFPSRASNLVLGDSNDAEDAFVRLVGADITYRANVDADGAQTSGSIIDLALAITPGLNQIVGPTVHVAFTTDARIDPTHDTSPNIFDVYLNRYRPFSVVAVGNSTTLLVSRSNGANTNASNGGEASISADGTKVSFTSSSGIDAADTGTDRDVYLRDIAAGTTTLVSRPDGVAGEADGASFAPQISGDGASVAFDSNATNMDDDSGADANGPSGRDVYVRRLAANETLTASLATGSLTQRGSGESLNASINSDGSRVAFLTAAANLGDGDINSTPDIHVRDLAANVTTWASRSDGIGGGPTEAGGRDAAISGDGATVLFDGPARGVAPGADGDANQVFVRALSAGTTRLVSRATGPDTTPFGQLVSNSQLSPADFDDGDGEALARRMTSADGRFVVFASDSDGLLAGQGSPNQQIFLRDMVTGTTRLVSHDATGAPGDGNSGQPTISSDGAAVAFTTRAPKLVTTLTAQVAVWRGATDRVTLVSATSTGIPGTGRSYSPALSADGSKIAFESQAVDLGESVAPGVLVNVWWRDLATGATRLAARADGAAGAPANGVSLRPAISADGSRVAFSTIATNLGDGDTSAILDVHVRDMPSGSTLWASRAGVAGAGGNGSSQHPSLSADGGVVAFESVATNLLPDDADAIRDVFTRDLGSGMSTLVSRAPGATGDKGTKQSRQPLISDDGRRVAFDSLAPNLASDDPNTLDDIFVRDVVDRTTVAVTRVDGAGGTLLGIDSFASFGASPDLHCIAFEGNRPAFVANGYTSPDFTQIYLRTVTGDCAANAAVPGAGAGAGGSGAGATGATGGARARVSLSKVFLQPRAFRTRLGKRGGAILRFTLSERAQVTIAVQRPRVGHRRVARCTVSARTGKRCTVWTIVGSLRLAGQPGANRTRFTGRLMRQTLTPGRYRMRLVATVAGGPPSAPRTVGFRIRR